MPLWLVGKWGTPWEFMGVFDEEKKALDICTSPLYFVAPITLNEVQPEETSVFPGMYYPLGDQ